MDKIVLMDENLSNKIAAGEVIERIMNVVKELVENSIDAGSTNISISLFESGLKEIVVSDDGSGMSRADALKCFERHATSKLLSLDDLFSIGTLGFRGEALPSIASVSKLTLKTSDGNSSTRIEIEGGEVISINDDELLKGTTISVRELFYNTPVRFKYIKNLYAEVALVSEYINKIALSYPNIRFSLENDDKVLLKTFGNNNLLSVIHAIYGLEVSKKMIEFSESNNDYEIYGYMSYPEVSRSNKNSITTLVNGRVIKNNEIVKTIVDAYHTYMPVDKYPICVININTDPSLIDVNIHPTKMDIKFSKIIELKTLITDTFVTKLKEKLLIPEVIVENNNYFEKNIEVHEESIKYNNVEDIKLDIDSAIERCSNIEKTPDENKNDDNRIKPMYPIGVVHGTYIIAENELGMYVIDQHAAAERINYEKYLKNMMNSNYSCDLLLVPITIELTNKEYLILSEHFDILDKLKFQYMNFGINTIAITSHPSWLPKYALAESIRKIIDIIISNEDFNEERFREHVAITLACKLSIKGNQAISIEDMTYLLETLRMTDNPFTCPHGRPTIITYSKYTLEKLFKRSE